MFKGKIFCFCLFMLIDLRNATSNLMRTMWNTQNSLWFFLCHCRRMSFSSNLNHYGMVHVASVSDVLLDTSFTPPCQRMGAMVAFRSFQEFTRWDLLLVGPTWKNVIGYRFTDTCLQQEHKWCAELLLRLSSSESNLSRGRESCPVWRRGQQGKKKRPLQPLFNDLAWKIL